MRWPVLDNYGHWRRWFAWYPVQIEDDWVWFEWIERREYETWGGGGYLYREIGDE